MKYDTITDNKKKQKQKILPNSNKNKHGIEKNWLEQLRRARKVLRNFGKRKKRLNATKLMMHTQETYKNLVAFMQ